MERHADWTSRQVTHPGRTSGPLPSDAEILGIPRMSPMLAGTAKAPFDADGWLFEPKWDGYRCLAYVTPAAAYLDSRNRKPLLPKFPRLAGIAPALKAREALLDGEVIAVRGGKVDFSYLRTGPSSVLLVAFDILWLDGETLLATPLAQRREALQRAVEWGGTVIMSESVEDRGKALFTWARDRDMEGVMAKRRDSLYCPGQRSRDWLKIKNLHEGTFWVVGYMPGTGRPLGSLVIAQKAGGGYSIVGRVSSGLNRRYEEFFQGTLEPAALAGVPQNLENLPARAELRQIHWVVPFYGVEVTYTEMTPDGRLRHPVFREVAGSGAC